MAERQIPPAPPPWTPPQSPLAALGDARVAALKLVGSLLLVVAAGVGLLVYGDTREDVNVAELRELVAGGGVAASEPDEDAPASLWVDIGPIGSTVFVDGDSVGTTPLWVESIPPGARWIQVIGLDGVVLDTTVSVAGGEMAELDRTPSSGVELSTTADGEPADAAVEIAEADPPRQRAEAPPRQRAAPDRVPSTGDLRVTSSPSGATVRVDGRRVGTTPLSLDGLQAGRHSVSITRDGYETTVRRVDIEPGSRLEASFALRPQEAAPPAATPRPVPPTEPAPEPEVSETGTVEILVRPWGRIVIDGTTHQREADFVYRTTLPVGSHRITVSHPQLGTSERTIIVQPGGLSRIEFDLTSGS